MPATPAGVMPGTWSWPRMWPRSRGMSYLSARYFTSLAEFRYIGSEYQVAPEGAKPSCSMPIECMLTYQLPACQATSLVGTCWAMSPSDERTE